LEVDIRREPLNYSSDARTVCILGLGDSIFDEPKDLMPHASKKHIDFRLFGDFDQPPIFFGFCSALSAEASRCNFDQ
jgi:hypothetical protein